MSDDEQRNGTADDLLRAAPGLARIAGEAWWRTAEWTVDTSLRTSSRVLRAALSGQAPGDLFSASGADVRAYVRRLLGIDRKSTRLNSSHSQISYAGFC